MFSDYENSKRRTTRPPFDSISVYFRIHIYYLSIRETTSRRHRSHFSFQVHVMLHNTYNILCIHD